MAGSGKLRSILKVVTTQEKRATGDMVFETPGLLTTKSFEAPSAPEATRRRFGRDRRLGPARAAAAAGELHPQSDRRFIEKR
ncbi:hypothetical protein GW7_03013 [Heterocephalus glaber]|uniref:Uncharacterized protein n=1 Tax=Heterocephalus glaber TaxID=10181 RepID=G5BKH8_HETGA|nr:hypothetical protein GW7_03013 [Heterocephalus glaber]